MPRRILAVGLAVAALTACTQPSSKPAAKSGPAVATGNGITITAEEFKARLDEQSPFIRARYAALDRKKEFLDNLVRFEVLAKEAERQGLDKDPDVQNTLRKVMVQKLVQKNFGDPNGAKDLPDAESQKYYDEHKDEFQKAKRVRLSAIVLNAPAGSKERGAKLAAARKVVAEVTAAEKTNPAAFGAAVGKHSEDQAAKATAGDLGFRSLEELEKSYGKAAAEAAFALKAGALSAPLETPAAVVIFKATGVQEEVNRPFDQVKAQIAARLYREKKTKEFDELVKKLKEDAKVSVNDAELEKIVVAAAPAGGPGMPGMPPGMGGGMGGGMPGGMPGMPPAGPPGAPHGAPHGGPPMPPPAPPVSK
jgi:peptidyl-prolyl cis-trans isomerase C